MPRKLNDHASARDKLLVLYQRLTLDSRKLFQSDIAHELECSPQTVTRLIGVIEKHLGKDEIESGLDGRRRYYRLRSKTEEKAMGFSFEKLRYLATCRDLAAPFLPKAVAERINKSLTALALLLGENATRSVPGMSIGFHGKGFIDYSPHLVTISTLNKAIDKRSVCNVVYRPNGRREEATYRYAPGRILAMGGTLYVQGYRLVEKSLLKDRPTTFLLHRISLVVSTLEYFQFDAADGDARAFGLSWHKPKQMQVRVAPSAADYVRDRIWSDDQIIEEMHDGSILLSLTTTSEKELQAWVASFRANAQIINSSQMTMEHSP